MPPDIHSLVENAYDIHPVGMLFVKYEVRADRIFEIALADIDTAAFETAGCQSGKSQDHIRVIFFRLCG